jgi:hypothetical protein
MNKITTDGEDWSEAVDINNSGLILGKIKLQSVIMKDGVTTKLDPDSNYVSVNNHDEIVGNLDDNSFVDLVWFNIDQANLDNVRFLFPRGRAALYINGKTTQIDNLVGDTNLYFFDAKGINDNGQILVTGFDAKDGFYHEYLISLPSNISTNIKNIRPPRLSDIKFNYQEAQLFKKII